MFQKKHVFLEHMVINHQEEKDVVFGKIIVLEKIVDQLKKKCSWVGFVYKKTLKTRCNWKRKSQYGIQRNCCRYFRVCRFFKKRRQCKNGKKICKWSGAQISTIPIRNCRFRPVGRFSRRKLCCRFRRICKGKVCSKTTKRCGFVGPKFSLIPVSFCSWRRVNKVTLRRRCCTATKHCINKKCKTSKRKCSWTGIKVKANKRKKCVWKALRSRKGFAFRQRFCCVYHKLRRRIVKSSCKYIGRKIIIRRKYWKKRTICTRSYPSQTCCTSAFRCISYGKKQKCKYFKKLGCKTYKKARTTVLKTIRKCKLNSKFKKCCLYKYKCVGSKSYRRRTKKRCVLLGKSQCSKQKFQKKHTFTCQSTGDPHYTTFSKKNFDYYTPGDWILAKSKSFIVSTRTRPWNSASVNVRLAARVNKQGELIEIKASKFDQVKINKNKIVNLPVGKKYLFYYGGNVIRNSVSQITITSSNGDILEAFTFNMGFEGKKNNAPYIMNLFMKVSRKNIYSGLCSASNSIFKSNDFAKEYIPHAGYKPKKCKGTKRRLIMERCNRRFKNRNLRNGCIVDLCSKIPMEIEKKI